MPQAIAPITRSDLTDLVLLASVSLADRRGLDRAAFRRQVAGLIDDDAADTGCRALVARCLLVTSPSARIGYRVALLGLARMQRFLRSAVGSAAPAAHLCEECAVRRMLLDALDLEDREELALGMCQDLVEMRDGLLVCTHAESCDVGGCPFNTAARLDEIDMALVWLAEACATGTPAGAQR